MSLEALRAIGSRPVLQLTPSATAMHELLTDPAGPVAPGQFAMTDHGNGAGIARAPRLALVWFGDDAERADVETFARDMIENGIMDCLSVYGVGKGSLLPSVRTDALPSGTYADTEIQQHVQALIGAGVLPIPDGETCYAAMLPDGITVTADGEASCGAWCGIHEALGTAAYISIQPATRCSGCHSTAYTTLQARQAILWHEFAEFATDKVPGEGVYDDKAGNEIGDVYAWNPCTVGPYVLQPVAGPDGGAIIPSYTPPAPQQPFADSLSFWQWLEAYFPQVIDAIEQADPAPEHRSTFEAWKSWFHANRYDEVPA